MREQPLRLVFAQPFGPVASTSSSGCWCREKSTPLRVGPVSRCSPPKQNPRERTEEIGEDGEKTCSSSGRRRAPHRQKAYRMVRTPRSNPMCVVFLCRIFESRVKEQQNKSSKFEIRLRTRGALLLSTNSYLQTLPIFTRLTTSSSATEQTMCDSKRPHFDETLPRLRRRPPSSRRIRRRLDGSPDIPRCIPLSCSRGRESGRVDTSTNNLGIQRSPPLERNTLLL